MTRKTWIVWLFQQCSKARGVIQSGNASTGLWTLLYTSDSEFSESILQSMTRLRPIEEATLDSITLARQILDIVEDKQATNITLMDVHELTTLATFFIIATVNNPRQSKAIEDDLLEKLRLQQSIRPLRIEGAQSAGTGDSGWALLDYGDVIVHLFNEEMREYYRLEELWNKAPIVAKVI